MATGHQPSLATRATGASVAVNTSGVAMNMIIFQNGEYSTVSLLAFCYEQQFCGFMWCLRVVSSCSHQSELNSHAM